MLLKTREQCCSSLRCMKTDWKAPNKSTSSPTYDIKHTNEIYQTAYTDTKKAYLQMSTNMQTQCRHIDLAFIHDINPYMNRNKRLIGYVFSSEQKRLTYKSDKIVCSLPLDLLIMTMVIILLISYTKATVYKAHE